MECLIDDVNENDHGYIVFDNQLKIKYNVRIRRDIFPNDLTTIYDVNI